MIRWLNFAAEVAFCATFPYFAAHNERVWFEAFPLATYSPLALLGSGGERMSKVVPIDSGKPSDERVEACLRAYLVFECLPILAPNASADRRRRLADEILSMCRGMERRVRTTPRLLEELLRNHASCVLDQEGRCPLLVSVSSLCWEINLALGVGNEEDEGFRRHDTQCAARPLSVERFERKEE
jgi:hypothetical protein